MRVIEVENLKKSYLTKRGHFEALKGVSFSVEKGEVYGILGPNGAGKTTTLEIIEGLKQQTSGSVKVLGFNNLTSPVEIKNRIGVQLQSSDYLPYLTLTELLKLFGSLYGKKVDTLKLLKRVNLQEKAGELVQNLSGGQKQRFTIASSLVNNPEIVFLDEPTTGLDPHARRNLWQLIKELNLEGITIVLTTHYMEEAEYLCNRVAILDQGRILKIDRPKKLVEDLSHTTQVSFLTDQPVSEDIFKNFPEVEKVYSMPPKIIIEIKSLEHVSEVVKTLRAVRINFSGFTVKTASLEDVYLDLTGKEYLN